MTLRRTLTIAIAHAGFLTALSALGGCSDDDSGIGASSSTGAAGAGGAATTSTTSVGGNPSGGAGGGAGVGGDGGDGAVGPTGGPVVIDGVYNARHTGGLLASDGLSIRDFVLIRSGHLSDITDTGCQQFGALGIETVVDLRESDGTTGVTANPDAACVTSTASYVHVELPKLLPPSESVYLQILAAAEPRLGDIFAAIGGASALPAVVHCVIGRDRANIVMALVLLGLGVPRDAIIADFTSNQDAAVAAEVQAAWLEAVIDYVDDQGGIDAYLLSHAVTAEQLAALRASALE